MSVVSEFDRDRQADVAFNTGMFDTNLTNPPTGGEVRQSPSSPTPWSSIGMSRATWYRHGKPTAKPSPRLTRSQIAAAWNTSVRGIQRALRITRLAPELEPFIESGALPLGYAEKLAKRSPEERRRFLDLVLRVDAEERGGAA